MSKPNLEKNKPKSETRVRIAPSPTGYLHIGGARTALFNFLFARKHKGKFILRIEDTDVERSKPKYEKDILKSLKWLGLEWDEGPLLKDKTPSLQRYIGSFGPYRQSERKSIYQKYVKRLLKEEKAYRCFCTEKELEAQRQYQLSIGKPPKYTGECRNLSPEKVKKYLKQGRPNVIRIKMPSKEIEFKDLIRGKVEFDTELIGDIAIAKDLKNPLYNLAAVIDDYQMEISHVIRGEEHISNTPKQLILQEMLGLPHPQYAHLSLILGPDRSKLSKRHGAVALSEFIKKGYLPEALINFMALLGWHPSSDREIFSLPSLIKEFSLDRCQKGGSVFNRKRLNWINGFYIRQRSTEKITELCVPYLIESGLVEEIENNFSNLANPGPPSKSQELRLFEEKKAQFRIKETQETVDIDWIKKVVGLYQERLKKLSEISELTDFFFKEKLEYKKELLSWKEASLKETKNALDQAQKVLSSIEKEQWQKKEIKGQLMPVAKRVGDRGKILWPLRVALTGKKGSAGPFEVAGILGKEKTLKRIKQAKDLLRQKEQ